MRARRLTGVAGALAVGTIALAVLAPAAAVGHGLVGRSDLPVPQWLFGWGATVVLVVSFVALGSLWRRPVLERDSWRPLADGLSRVLTSRPLEIVCGASGIALLAVVVYSGFAGAERVDANLTPTFVYVVFWLGFVPVSVLFGDVFRAFNPWLAVGRAASWALGRWAPEPFTYPERLGRWPAALGLLAFAWLELVSTNGDRPATIALAIAVYSMLTWLGMYVFGVQAWTRRGEAFSVYFNLLSRLSVFERRDRRIGLRRPLSGLTSVQAVPGTVAVLAVMIGTVSFDGFSGGGTWQGLLADMLDGLRSLGVGSSDAVQLAYTAGLLAVVGLTYGFYRVGVAGAAQLAGKHRAADLARAFAHSLVPIALAYVAAHYVSLLLLQGQAVAALASDPLGDGANLFGTATWTIDYGLLGAEVFWYLQVGFVVLGHMGALALAHDRALVLYDDARRAVRSQYWMLGVMVGFTSLALWLLSEANKG